MSSLKIFLEVAGQSFHSYWVRKLPGCKPTPFPEPCETAGLEDQADMWKEAEKKLEKTHRDCLLTLSPISIPESDPSFSMVCL